MTLSHHVSIPQILKKLHFQIISRGSPKILKNTIIKMGRTPNRTYSGFHRLRKKTLHCSASPNHLFTSRRTLACPPKISQPHGNPHQDHDATQTPISQLNRAAGLLTTPHSVRHARKSPRRHNFAQAHC